MSICVHLCIFLSCLKCMDMSDSPPPKGRKTVTTLTYDKALYGFHPSPCRFVSVKIVTPNKYNLFMKWYAIGTFIRHGCGAYGEVSSIGSGLQEQGFYNYVDHLFDCFGTGTNFKLQAGEATFTNRYGEKPYHCHCQIKRLLILQKMDALTRRVFRITPYHLLIILFVLSDFGLQPLRKSMTTSTNR